jgi:hypothetical protein
MKKRRKKLKRESKKIKKSPFFIIAAILIIVILGVYVLSNYLVKEHDEIIQENPDLEGYEENQTGLTISDNVSETIELKTEPTSNGGSSGGSNPEASEESEYTLGLNIFPDSVCRGENFVGTVYSNMPNASCTTYASRNGLIWYQYANYTLDAFGSYSEFRSIDTNGTAKLYVECSYDSRQISSPIRDITVNDCYYCHDTDAGQNKFSMGVCEDAYHKAGFPDVCIDNYQFNEYYCNSSGICIQIRMICGPSELCISGHCVSI